MEYDLTVRVLQELFVPALASRDTLKRLPWLHNVFYCRFIGVLLLCHFGGVGLAHDLRFPNGVVGVMCVMLVYICRVVSSSLAVI